MSDYIDVSKTEEGNWMTYEAAADALGIPYAAFRQAVAKFGGAYPAFDRVANWAGAPCLSAHKLTR